MTEKLPPLTTQIVLPSQSAPLSSTLVSASDASHKVELVEEEPYTIKCICKFSGDDGNTIFCETCETWQHIECFYPNNVEDAVRPDFAHSCAECNPRPLDRQQAFERQRLRITGLHVVEEVTDKKPKRPPSKSHKKKPKPTDLQLANGHPPIDSHKHAASNDAPAAKKPKTSHKPSQSVSSQAPKRSPPYASGRTVATTNGHPPSPATTPPELPQDFELHSYTSEFVSLYNQKSVQIVQTNSFASLNISNTMSLWLREPEKLRQETGWEFGDVFQSLPPNIDSLKQPVRLETHELRLASDTAIRWNYLTAPAAVEGNVPLIELNGLIGFQKDYSADKSNRWDEFTSPLPFVFFLEMLPLYIDTRHEGSRARYVRRSCKPNAVIDTFLSGGSEYHFWLVSDRPIKANEQITIAWDFRFPKQQKARMLHLLGLGDEDVAPHDKSEIDDIEYQNVASWVYLMLSEYGGCACDLGNNCAFVRFHRNHLARSQPRVAAKKKHRKPKTHVVSPTSTGHATNSRAASEGRLDEGAEADAGSASGSARSKPPSRDMTPAQTTPAPRQGSFDTLGILTEPTDRDKRKVAMVEDSFRRMEQHQPPRKKKRVSDGASSTSSSSKPKAKVVTSGQPNGSHYVDAGTCRSKSGSPVSTTSPSARQTTKPLTSRNSSAPAASRKASTAPRATYADASVQTDPEPGQWYSEPSVLTVRPKKRYTSLSKRLLEERHIRRREEEERRKKRESLSSQSGPLDAMVLDSPNSDTKQQLSSPVTSEAPPTSASDGTTPDVPMTDAPPSPPVPPVVVTEAGPTDSLALAPRAKAPELRVQMPPPPPALNGSAATISTNSTPLSATGSALQSPFSSNAIPSPFPLSATSAAAAPSPVKKKLSLSDYTKSRKAAAGRPPMGIPLKATTSNPDDPKSATSVETPSASDSPSTDKATESLIPSLDVTVSGTSA